MCWVGRLNGTTESSSEVERATLMADDEYATCMNTDSNKPSRIRDCDSGTHVRE